MYTVYVLYSETYNKTYTGMSSNMMERFKSHNELGKKGWTKDFRPWVIFYQEEYLEKQMALKREKYFKTGAGRRFIRSLIEMRVK
jgi:putative endonuclease